MQTAQLSTVEVALGFVLAGNATFTLVSSKTGMRFTFRISQPKDTKPHQHKPYFVALLNGPDNTSNYQYLGTLLPNMRTETGVLAYNHGRKSSVSEEATSVKAFRWFWNKLVNDNAIPADCEVWHEGRCGRCGRKLTVPSSISLGLGPECAGKE